jgi:hypothetical protein
MLHRDLNKNKSPTLNKLTLNLGVSSCFFFIYVILYSQYDSTNRYKHTRSSTASSHSFFFHTNRSVKMCVMLPTLTWKREDQNFEFRETVQRSPFFSVSLPSILDTTSDEDNIEYLLLVGHNPDDAIFGSEELGSVEGARQHALEIITDLVGSRHNVHVLLRPLYGTTGTTVLWNTLA